MRVAMPAEGDLLRARTDLLGSADLGDITMKPGGSIQAPILDASSEGSQPSGYLGDDDDLDSVVVAPKEGERPPLVGEVWHDGRRLVGARVAHELDFYPRLNEEIVATDGHGRFSLARPAFDVDSSAREGPRALDVQCDGLPLTRVNIGLPNEWNAPLRLELEAGARVVGPIDLRLLVVAPGATLAGRSGWHHERRPSLRGRLIGSW